MVSSGSISTSTAVAHMGTRNPESARLEQRIVIKIGFYPEVQNASPRHLILAVLAHERKGITITL